MASILSLVARRVIEAEDVVLAVQDYGRGIPEDIETYFAGKVLEYG
jgi:hypothetical protein